MVRDYLPTTMYYYYILQYLIIYDWCMKKCCRYGNPKAFFGCTHDNEKEFKWWIHALMLWSFTLHSTCKEPSRCQYIVHVNSTKGARKLTSSAGSMGKKSRCKTVDHQSCVQEFLFDHGKSSLFNPSIISPARRPSPSISFALRTLITNIKTQGSNDLTRPLGNEISTPHLHIYLYD